MELDMSKNRDRRVSSKVHGLRDEGPVEDGRTELQEEERIIDQVFEEDMRRELTPKMADTLLGERLEEQGGRDDDGDDSHIIRLKSGEKNRLHRAEMHLNFLIMEMTAIANEGALIGVFRRACAECQVVFNDSNAALWGPLKSISDVLDTVKRDSGM